MVEQVRFCCELPLVKGNVAMVEQMGFCCELLEGSVAIVEQVEFSEPTILLSSILERVSLFPQEVLL